jgi:hypothetical protein
MSKKDISNKIEKILAFEQKLSVEILSLSAFLDTDDDEFMAVYLQGEIKSSKNSVDDDFSIVAAVYDSNDRVVATTDHFISSEDFMGFDVFSMSVDIPTKDISKIKIYPKK